MLLRASSVRTLPAFNRSLVFFTLLRRQASSGTVNSVSVTSWRVTSRCLFTHRWDTRGNTASRTQRCLAQYYSPHSTVILPTGGKCTSEMCRVELVGCVFCFKPDEVRTLLLNKECLQVLHILGVTGTRDWPPIRLNIDQIRSNDQQTLGYSTITPSAIFYTELMMESKAELTRWLCTSIYFYIYSKWTFKLCLTN